MVLLRDVFRLRVGKAKEAKALWEKMAGIHKSQGSTVSIRRCPDSPWRCIFP